MVVCFMILYHYINMYNSSFKKGEKQKGIPSPEKSNENPLSLRAMCILPILLTTVSPWLPQSLVQRG